MCVILPLGGVARNKSSRPRETRFQQMLTKHSVFNLHSQQYKCLKVPWILKDKYLGCSI